MKRDDKRQKILQKFLARPSQQRRTKGQMTIFIILGIVIVGLAVMLYLYYPKIKTAFFEEESPSAFIQSCLENDVLDSLDLLSSHGGSLEPVHYVAYQGEKIEYLCYTEEYYKPCVMQQPLLKNHIESEIKEKIKTKTDECFNSMVENYKKEGYQVELKNGGYDVELLPKRVVINFNNSLSLTKDNSENYDSFNVVVNNNIYELISVANSILNWETRYGDSETTTYMNYYRDLKVEKKKQSDGTTIYILTDRNNGNKFQFASRSVAWPAGWSSSNSHVSELTWEGVVEE